MSCLRLFLSELGELSGRYMKWVNQLAIQRLQRYLLIMKEAEEELGKLPATALVKELKEANQDRKNVLIKVRLKIKNHYLTLNKINVLFCIFIYL